MSEILSSASMLPMRMLLILVAIILVGLWVVSVIWVNRDARMREAAVVPWTIVAVVPVAGLVAYCLLRPPLNSIDSAEQAMNIELMGRQLADYGNCPRCGEAVKRDYVVCPQCCAQLRNVCSRCGRPLEPGWQMCPYCAQPVPRPHRQAPDRPE